MSSLFCLRTEVLRDWELLHDATQLLTQDDSLADSSHTPPASCNASQSRVHSYVSTGVLRLQSQFATDWPEALAAAVHFDSKGLPMQ